MEIVTRKIKDLTAADYNPRKLSKEQEADIVASIKKFGLVDPVIVNTYPGREDTIVGGHQRIRVCKKLGLKEVPTVEVSLALEDEKELNVRLNKNSGGWDEVVLQDFFQVDKLIDWGFEEREVGYFNLDASQLGDGFQLPDWAKGGLEQITFTMTSEQAVKVRDALAEAQQMDSYKAEKFKGNRNGDRLYFIIKQWAGQKK